MREGRGGKYRKFKGWATVRGGDGGSFCKFNGCISPRELFDELPRLKHFWRLNPYHNIQSTLPFSMQQCATHDPAIQGSDVHPYSGCLSIATLTHQQATLIVHIPGLMPVCKTFHNAPTLWLPQQRPGLPADYAQYAEATRVQELVVHIGCSVLLSVGLLT